MNSEALSKTLSVFLIIVIVVGSGITAYIIFIGNEQIKDTIKIGLFADLGTIYGDSAEKAAILAAEQINAGGGLLRKQIEIISEDNDALNVDLVKVNSALTRLITHDQVDFIVGGASGEAAFVTQELIAQHKKIYISYVGSADALTQNVLDDYDKYKHYFRFGLNDSVTLKGISESRISLRDTTGFTKVGYLAEDLSRSEGMRIGMENFFTEANGFELVYRGTFPLGTVDFSSYFAAAEAAGTEILIPLIAGSEAIPFVKEYSDRQSPMIIYGGYLHQLTAPEGWEWTDGKCEYITVGTNPVLAGYPLTTKTLQSRQEYIERWGEAPTAAGASTYDIIRYVLVDAIERAGTLETDEVISALETTSIETSLARNFVFTSSHSTMFGRNVNNPQYDYMITILCQWIDGEQVPVYPKEIMEEASASYAFPDWSGPWD